MSEDEAEKILSKWASELGDKVYDLTEFLSELKNYRILRYKAKNRNITKKEINEMMSLREKLLGKASAFRSLITELTGKDKVMVTKYRQQYSYDIWFTGLGLKLGSHTLDAIGRCIDVTIAAIGKLEDDIEMGKRDKQGNIIGEPPKDATESPVNLFGKMQFHPRVIEVSESLFKTGNYSSAIFEAFKAVHNYVQDKTGLTLDGVNLMEKVFNENKPILQLNELLTKSDRDEQKGFKYLFMGSQMGIRNPQAHENVKPEEQNIALEYLGIASLLMRRIDGSKLVKLNI